MKEALAEVNDFVIIFIFIINSTDMFFTIVIFWRHLNVAAIFAPNRWIL